MIVKISNDFNSIEWEVDSIDEVSVEELVKVKKILIEAESLYKNTVEEDKKGVYPPEAKKEKKLATEAQKKLMRQKGISYDEGITSQQAFFKLKEASHVFPNKYIK